MPLQLCLHEKVSGLLCVPQHKVESGEIMCFQIQHYLTAENMAQLIKILGGQQFLPCIKLETLLSGSCAGKCPDGKVWRRQALSFK